MNIKVLPDWGWYIQRGNDPRIRETAYGGTYEWCKDPQITDGTQHLVKFGNNFVPGEWREPNTVPHRNWHHWDKLNNELSQQMPMLLDMDPDTTSMLSDITLVVESYVSDTVIAFSEKIFRALQTPRPWILFCSPGSVAILRSAGFDVMDDVVDHSYDEIVNVEQRLQAIIKELKKLKYFSLPRYEQAVETNQAILDKLKHQWSYKLQSIFDSNQS